MLDSLIPETLTEMQTWFAELITAPIQASDSSNIPLFPKKAIDEIRKRISPGPDLSSEERLGLYQQQYWWRLLNICQEIFPTLVRLFGYDDFNRLIAEPYLLKYPSNDWFLSSLGTNLPKWIKKHYRAKDKALVLELALLDLAYEKIPFKELMPRIEPHHLSECEKKKLLLQPYIFLFEFHVDLFDFRAQLLKHSPLHWQSHNFPLLQKSEKKRYFVLFRSHEESVYEEVSFSFFTLLARLKKGAKLTDLISLLESSDGLFESFRLMAAREWLTFSKQRARIL